MPVLRGGVSHKHRRVSKLILVSSKIFIYDVRYVDILDQFQLGYSLKKYLYSWGPGMPKSESLIRTKLHLPFTRKELVHRPRLQEQVAQGLRGPLTLVTAPAGFGKTTLVAYCITGCGLPVAWLSLGKNDNQAGRFIRYLVAAMQEADPKIGLEAAQLGAGGQPAQPESVLTSLINDLDGAGREMVLVLDDYQFINSQEVHSAVAFLLEYCPSTLHLVISSRSDPPLPLALLRARGEMVELRAADLSFTESEAAQFLNQVMKLGLDAGSVSVLAERTEGWIAGLQMAALSLRNREDVAGFIEGFSGTQRHILDYLLEEVLASQPAEIQHFLLSTSILERLTAPLCDALLSLDEKPGPKDEGESYEEKPSLEESSAVLEYLERANLFLVPLDDEREWYRYHHLFADLLRVRLQQAQPDIVPRLHLRASTWLEQSGYIRDAIHHLFEVGEFERAADLIDHWGSIRMAEGYPRVFQMAESLPREMLLARPKIGLYLAWLLILHSDIGSAIPLLNDLAQRLEGEDPLSGKRWMHTFVVTALAFLSPASTLEVDPLPDEQLLDEIPWEEPILRRTADFLYGMTLGRRGEWERAVQVALKCIQREKASLSTQAIPTLAPFLSRVYLMQGRIKAAASLCREYLDPIRESGIRFVFSAGSMKIDLGEALYEWNCLEEGERYVREGIRDNEPWQNIMTYAFGHIALVRLLQAKGDFSEAMQTAEKFETNMHSHSRTPREFDEDLLTLRARIQLASGDLHGAIQWAEQVQLSEDYGFHKEFYRLTLARIRLAQGRYAEVEKLLEGISPPPGAGSRISRQIECNLLLGVAFARRERLGEAIGLVEASLALGEPEGYLRVFLDGGEALRELLGTYLRSATADHKLYAQKIMNAFSLTPAVSPANIQQAGLVEPLSGRELEVLNLMAMGRTNQEIARQLIVSPGTVKAHTSSIYRKLLAANRTEAVARARQFGILL
jgi:LuxR family transcriptional regulator, maltose regulon positive regulatory protein